ncbi:MAG: FkbM family methyltransferase [Cyanobacteriota bacterium]
MNNTFALKTLNYIWTHPNCRHQKIPSVLRFFNWQAYKRFTHRHRDLQLLPNVKLRCYPDSASAATVLYCGLYDYDEMNFLLRYLRPEDSFLDIGANIGVYTLLAASKIQSGSIHSFEALPKNYERLQENIKLNSLEQVKTHAIAVSNQTGSVALNLAEGDSMPFITHSATDSTLTVPTDTLDNQLQPYSVSNLTLAKMDIEGAELLALKGAVSLLKQQRPYVWILEINDSVNHFGYRKEDVVDFLHSFGYSLYRYSALTNQISPITLEQQQGNNVLAIADSAVEFVRDRLTKVQLA